MSNIPLVNNNSIDAINTSIIAIKKNLNNNGQIQDVDVNVGINIATNCTYCAASSTTIKGAQLYNGCSIKVLFTSAITGSDTTTPMSINYNDVSIPVKTGKNGVLSNFVANNINGSYIYCQAYTTLELLFDGTQFIIMGNPVVISRADYTIYTDGTTTYTDSKIEDLIKPFKCKRIGEIYYKTGYSKVEETEYYGRPMVYIVTTSSGGFDILIFGNNCTAKRISLGTISSQIQFKYKTGSSGSSGYLYIYTVNAILSTCIFELNTYLDTIGVLSNSDSTEFNSGSNF